IETSRDGLDDLVKRFLSQNRRFKQFQSGGLRSSSLALRCLCNGVNCLRIVDFDNEALHISRNTDSLSLAHCLAHESKFHQCLCATRMPLMIASEAQSNTLPQKMPQPLKQPLTRVAVNN